jgi:CBS-domain-containing membrane protein
MKQMETLKVEAHLAEAKAIDRLLRESTTCGNWMTLRPYTVVPSDSLNQARRLLKLHGINQLPVVPRGSKTPVGIVTDRDLRAAANLSYEDLTVESVMTRPAITLARHSTLINAAEVMRASRIGSVPITDGEALVGIISRSDILDAFVAFSQGRYRRVAARPGKASDPPGPAGILKPGTIASSRSLERRAAPGRVRDARDSHRRPE